MALPPRHRSPSTQVFVLRWACTDTRGGQKTPCGYLNCHDTSLCPWQSGLRLQCIKLRVGHTATLAAVPVPNRTSRLRGQSQSEWLCWFVLNNVISVDTVSVTLFPTTVERTSLQQHKLLCSGELPTALTCIVSTASEHKLLCTGERVGLFSTTLFLWTLSQWLCSPQLLKEQVAKNISCFAVASSPPP